MDRLDAMALVLDIARAGSLSAAARQRRMPIATLSRRISDLEARLGARVFARAGRRLALTEAGEIYAAACRRILDDVAEAERAAAGEYRAPRGELTVTAPVVFGQSHVLPVVTDFLRDHPDIDLRLLLSDQPLNLADEHVDIGIRIGPLRDSQLRARLVGSTRRVVCASPAYLAAHGTPVRPEDLAGHAVIALDSLVSTRGWSFGEDGRDVIIPVRARLKVNSTAAAVEAAKAGLGLVRALSYQVADACLRGDLQIVLARHEPAPWPVHLLHDAQGPVPLKVRAFLDWAAPRLKAALTV